MLSISPYFACAQQDFAMQPCSQPESKQFNFWIGEQDLKWGENGKGRNVIERTLDGCVIVEKFDGTPAMQLKGMSVSTFNSRLGKWQQTWVDNQGGYLDFIGEFVDSKMILQRKAMIYNQKVRQRMVWYDISHDSLMWHWERSGDDGETWEVMWQIKYTRRK